MNFSRDRKEREPGIEVDRVFTTQTLACSVLSLSLGDRFTLESLITEHGKLQ